MARDPKPIIDAKVLRKQMATHVEFTESFYNRKSIHCEVYASECKKAFLQSETLADYYVLRGKLRETYFGEAYEKQFDLDNELPF